MESVITLGRAFIDIVNHLRKKRPEKKVYRYTINCSSTYFIALAYLNMQGAPIGRSVYFHSFGFQCLLIANDTKKSNIVHVVIYSNEGELIDYAALSF
jgi:hypothetical protein